MAWTLLTDRIYYTTIYYLDVMTCELKNGDVTHPQWTLNFWMELAPESGELVVHSAYLLIEIIANLCAEGAVHHANRSWSATATTSSSPAIGILEITE